jgi:hypothetical protein
LLPASGRALSPLQAWRELQCVKRIGSVIPEGKTMRWKISHRGHDPGEIDLLAALALVVVIVAAFRLFGGNPVAPSAATFIVPSQSVRW